MRYSLALEAKLVGEIACFFPRAPVSVRRTAVARQIFREVFTSRSASVELRAARVGVSFVNSDAITEQYRPVNNSCEFINYCCQLLDYYITHNYYL